MKKYLIILPAILLVLGGAGFLIWAQSGDSDSSYPGAREYAPNFWFDSEEKYYPTSPLDFYYDEELNELGGIEARAKYDSLSQEEKLENFKVFYKIYDSEGELVYQYWLFYVFNDSDNEHYGDWESIFVFVNEDNKNVRKAVGSFHYGSILNTEILQNDTTDINHVWDYIGKGSHANCVDYEEDGECNFWQWNFKEKWSSADKLHGLKVEHDSPYYDLKPIEEIKSVFGKKYGEDRPLITKEKSPSLGMVPIKFGKSKKYALPLGGDPPENAWNKKEFSNPDEVVPLTPTRLAKNISGFFSGAGNFIASIGRKISSPIGSLFTAQVSGIPTDSEGQTSEESSADSASPLTAGLGLIEESGGQELPGDVPTLNEEADSQPQVDPSAEAESDLFEEAQAEDIENPIVDESLEQDSEEAEQAPQIEQVPDTDIGQEPVQIKLDLPSASGDPVPPPPVVLVQNNVTFNAVSDSNSEEAGNQIVISGTAEADFPITIKQNPTYTTVTNKDGTWSKEVTLEEGINNFVITVENFWYGTTASTNLTVNLDSIAPTTTIAVANYTIDDTEFQIQWSAGAQDLDYYDVQYRIGEAGEWQAWETATTDTNKDYMNATTNTYYFRARGVDINQNIGEWQEISVVTDLYPIVINEIQLSDAEFVELYNPTANAISLEGYYFSYYPSTRTSWTNPNRNKVFPEDAEVPGNGYYLIGLEDYPILGGNPNADWQVYTSKQLGNSKGTVAIFPFNPKTATSSQYAYNNRVDAVGWDNDFDGDSNDISLFEQSPATTTPAAGESLTRDNNHSDTNNNSNDFSVTALITPTNSSGETYDPNFTTEPVWAMYQKDARHSGLATLSGPTWATSTQATTTWIFQMKKNNNTNNGGRSQPVIDYQGILYVLDNTGILHTINTDGTEKWSFKPEDETGVGAGWADVSPALSSDSQRVYSAHTDTENNKLWIFSVNTSDGTLDWKYSPSESGFNQSFTSPTIDESGNIYVASKYRLYSISSSGTSNWTDVNDGKDGILLSPSDLNPNITIPAISNGYVYVVAKVSNNSGDRYIWKLDASDGSEIWKENPTGNNATSNPVSISSSGKLYMGGSNNTRLYEINPSDGSESWNSVLGSGNVSGTTPTFDASGDIYVGTSGLLSSGLLYKVSATGTLRWSSSAFYSAVHFSAVVDSQGRVYVGAKNKFIYAINPADGTLIWEYELTDEPRGFAIGDGVVYVVSYDGKVYAFKD